jgi:predicted metal-dependent hydrolase
MADVKLRQAVALFNRRDFFHAHETLESAWSELPAEDRPLYEILIRLATALHLRLNRGGHRGAVNLLQQALVRLEDLRPQAAGLDTAALYDDVAGYVERLRAEPGRTGWRERFRVPRIRFAADTSTRSGRVG